MTDIIKLPTGKRARNRTSNSASGFWSTSSAEDIVNAAETCRGSHQIGLVTGPSGAGKTTAARQAVQIARDSDEDAYYLAMTPAAEGLQPGLLRIAAAIGAGCSSHGGANDLHDALSHHGWTPGTLLVLDEAQFMSDALLHAVRTLWDELDFRGRPIGILLVGTADLAERIEGRIARKSRAFEALRGRLGITVAVDRPELEDIATICEHLGIAGPQAQAIIANVARGRGGLHNVRRLVAHAIVLAGDGKQVGLSDLKKAASAMGVRA